MLGPMVYKPPVTFINFTCSMYKQATLIDCVHIKEQWQEGTIKSLSVIDYFPYTATYWKSPSDMFSSPSIK